MTCVHQVYDRFHFNFFISDINKSSDMEQQLILAKLPMNEQLDLSVHLGIIMPLKFPFNLFLNLNNLTDPDMNLVYFFIYALGQKDCNVGSL